MAFFEQEIIRKELEEMSELYSDIQKSLYAGQYYDLPEMKQECLSKLERLVELQEFLYFRARYSDESDAKEFADMLRQSAMFLGIPSGTDLSQIFSDMKQDIAKAKKKLDNPS